MEIDVEEPDADGAGGAAGDNEEPEAPERPPALPAVVDRIDGPARSGRQGDRSTHLLGRLPDRTAAARRRSSFLSRRPRSSARTASRNGSSVPWSIGFVCPRSGVVRLPVREGRGDPIVVPESAAEQRRGGGLVLETHSRLFSYTTPDGKTERVRALTVFLVNRRATVHRFYADVSYAFQARLELVCETRLPAAARSLRLSRPGLGPARRRSALPRRLRMGRRAQRCCGLGRRRGRCRARHARLDRSAADGRSRARRAERRRRAQGAGDVRHGDAGAAGRGGWRLRLEEPWPICPPFMELWIDAERKKLAGLAGAPARDGRAAHRRHGNGKEPHRRPASTSWPGTPERGRPSAS